MPSDSLPKRARNTDFPQARWVSHTVHSEFYLECPIVLMQGENHPRQLVTNRLKKKRFNTNRHPEPRTESSCAWIHQRLLSSIRL